jgi:hypothetical protein
MWTLTSFLSFNLSVNVANLKRTTKIGSDGERFEGKIALGFLSFTVE